MATIADICNLALAQLGDNATVTSIDPPDGSPQAGHCARWYPQALRKLVEEFDWSFLTCREKLAAHSSINEDVYDWKYSYAIPSKCVRVIRLLRFNPFKERFEPVRFEVEMNPDNGIKMILTNEKEPVIVYVGLNSNPSIYPAYFVQALVLLLAQYLVGPLQQVSGGSQSVMQALRQQYAEALSTAKTMDAKNSVHEVSWPLRIPAHIRARRV